MIERYIDLPLNGNFLHFHNFFFVENVNFILFSNIDKVAIDPIMSLYCRSKQPMILGFSKYHQSSCYKSLIKICPKVKSILFQYV